MQQRFELVQRLRRRRGVRRMRRVGIGYRRELHDWLVNSPPEVSCLEVTAEHFYDGGDTLLARLAACVPVSVHGLGLSLGTPGPLDHGELDRFCAVVERAGARWVSEHVAFTRAGGVDLGHLNPVPCSRDSLATLSMHVAEVQRACGRRLLLENIAADLRLPGEMDEPAFLDELCRRTGCGLLLDLANLYVNAHNHGYDPRRWLDAIDPRHVVQVHIVGYSEHGRRLSDEHARSIQPELYDLLDVVADFP
ncbi:MAG: DUF692 domain-containing protein, partial [Planctomycetes bacterium]|nr:DUF692 domain-containing protein [Planctomycetota bacterium]